MDRREFVKYLTAGTAGQFILPSASAYAASTLNVVIVGGGMAGATAAKYLRVWAKKLGIETRVSVTLFDQNSSYISNIMSNMVLTGEKTLTNLTYNYSNLTTKYGVIFKKATVTRIDDTNGIVYGYLNNTGSEIALNSTPYNKLILASGIGFDYTGLSLSDPDNLYVNDYDAIPHAWQAGAQTTLLRNQLLNMKAGNHVVMTIPQSPYRCPPGPYERACVIADWLRYKKSTSKVYLFDANQTSDGKPLVEPTNFGYAFANIHTNLVYKQNAKLTGVEVSSSGTAKMKALSFVPTTTAGNAVNALSAATTQVAEVANVIPKMKASQLVMDIFSTGDLAGGLDGVWASIDEKTYMSSKSSKIHVIGDSIKSANQPKAGHIGNQQAKICADAILREFTGLSPYPTPNTNSACFTPVTTNLNKQYGAMASWLTATFKYGTETVESITYNRMLKVSTNIESPGKPSKDNFDSMNKWFSSLMQDVYS